MPTRDTPARDSADLDSATQSNPTIVVDDNSVAISAGEPLLVSLLRAGQHPTGGGCLCMAGDCSHCLATVDGISYVRTCQVAARPDMVVERTHHQGAHPRLFGDDDGVVGVASASPGRASAEQGAASHCVPQELINEHCDVVVIGQGESGTSEAARLREQGLDVVTVDATRGEEAAGIYAGPMVLVRTPGGMRALHARREVVVATGAAEIQPVGLATELPGLVTARACEQLHASGIDLGRVVAIGEVPRGVDAQPVTGRFVRCEGDAQLLAVVTVDASGSEMRTECDTVSFGLGLHPRNALWRMGNDLPVRAVGDAALPSDIPPAPVEGTVCVCSGVTVSDLQHVWDNGFRELELVKRATLAGTGTCQGSGCMPHIRSFLEAQGKELQPPFTARPLTRQLTFKEVAAGAHLHATPRTPLHDEHLKLGAHMQRSGGWWRAWDYGDVDAERAAVRNAVSLGDVSTLGKFLVAGPDALAFLELLYPTKVATLKPGRSRYALLLDERGYVLDDGLICRESDQRFFLTLTSAGSTFGELWLRDWAESRNFEVSIVNQTQSLGAINITGPLAAELLVRAGVTVLPAFAEHQMVNVADVACHVLRLSFTGELSYELHHAAADSVKLWRALMACGKELGIRPHGLDALLRLRLEKGHIVVGQDTDFDSTPRRLDHAWAAKLSVPEFIGKRALIRTNKQPLDRQLVGLTLKGPASEEAPLEGTPVWSGERYAGHVTSSTDSSVCSKAVMLAWLEFEDGVLPKQVSVGGRDRARPARRASLPFYDPDGARSKCVVDLEALRSRLHTSEFDAVPAIDEGGEDSGWGRFRRLEATRIGAPADALESLLASAKFPDGALALRLAPDEALVLASLAATLQAASALSDQPPSEARLVERETGFASAWFSTEDAAVLLARGCAWQLPTERPAFAQGAAWDIPVKLWFERERTLLLVPAPLAASLEERIRASERRLVEGAR